LSFTLTVTLDAGDGGIVAMMFLPLVRLEFRKRLTDS